MTRRHAVLEATLKTLADDFASRVALATMRAPVTELGEAFDAGELRRTVLAALSRLAIEPLSPPSPATATPRRRAKRVARAPRAAVIDRSTVDGKKNPPREDVGAGAITDPSLLLLAMDGDRRTPPRDAPPARATVTTSAATGPTLRPGERLQRTSGGVLVLRRPGK